MTTLSIRVTPLHGGSDVSEQGFTRDGIAVMPDAEKVQELSGSDMAHWLKMKPEEKKTEQQASTAEVVHTRRAPAGIRQLGNY